MKKSDLTAEIVKQTNCKEEDIAAIIEAMLAVITESLKKGEKVSIHGFGKFVPRKYGKRKCYNPRTSELITLQPSVQPAFVAGPKLRAELNEKEEEK